MGRWVLVAVLAARTDREERGVREVFMASFSCKQAVGHMWREGVVAVHGRHCKPALCVSSRLHNAIPSPQSTKPTYMITPISTGETTANTPNSTMSKRLLFKPPSLLLA